MSSAWGDYTTPCPDCGGIVHYWSFGADCRGNDADNGIACQQCNRRFEAEEWNMLAAPEMTERSRDYWHTQYELFGPYRFSPYHPDYDFSVAKPL